MRVCASPTAALNAHANSARARRPRARAGVALAAAAALTTLSACAGPQAPSPQTHTPAHTQIQPPTPTDAPCRARARDLYPASSTPARTTFTTSDAQGQPFRATREISPPDQTGRWTIRLLEAPIESQPTQETQPTPVQTLTLSIAPDGSVLLHELVNHAQASTATFDPPIAIFPSELLPATPHAARSRVRVVTGPASDANVRTGSASATASIVCESQASAGTVRTSLTLALGAISIRRTAVITLAPSETDPDGTIAQGEVSRLRVFAGPLLVEDVVRRSGAAPAEAP